MIACLTGVSFSLFSRLQNSLYFSVNSNTRGSQTKGLQRGWKQRARLGRDVFFLSPHTGVWGSRLRLLRRALPISLLTLRKKTTVLQSTFFRRTKAFQTGSEPGAPSSDPCVRLSSLGALASTTAKQRKRHLNSGFFKLVLCRVYCNLLKMSNVGEIPWTNKFLGDGTHV